MIDQAAKIDPFAPGILDQETELTALTHALEFASDFSLLFVVCNQAPQRRRLMAEARARLPHFTIQEINFSEPVNHLLDALSERLAEPLPDAVFVSGLEHSLPDLARASTTPFIANLNASRNSFPQIVPRPLVMWVPEYALTAIAQGAPDFFSIRSGVYAFAAAPEELAGFARILSAGEHWQAQSLPSAEKRDRTAAIERLLAEYETLPVDRRDRRAELRLLDRLGVLLSAQGSYAEALRHFQRALKLAEELDDREGISNSLHQLGVLHQECGKYDEALQSYEQSLRIAGELGDHAGAASSLHQLGVLYQARKEYSEALRHYEQALRTQEELGDDAGVARSLHQLGILHQLRGEYGEALRHYEQSMRIFEKLSDRLGVASSLGQLGILHQTRGEYGEALQNYKESLRIAEEIGDHALIASLLAQIGMLFTETERYEEAFKPLLNALATLLRLQSPNAGIVANMVRALRERWGEQTFDATWRAATGGDVPMWVQETSGVTS